jgi:methylmalonyl-CoA carboxyltransferase large subunit
MAADPVIISELELVTPPKATIDDKIADLRRKRAKIKLGGGKARIEKHHTAGLLTAHERVEKLVDPESFQEIGAFAKHRSTYFGMAEKDLPADGVVTGCATVDGRLVHLASQDFTVAGAAGEVHCAKITEMMQLSLKTGSPYSNQERADVHHRALGH